MTLPEFLLTVDSQVSPQVEDDWNTWYNEVHLPEIMGCPGFISSARYVADDGESRRYLALYELSDLSAVESIEFDQRRGWGPFADDVVATVRIVRRIAAQGASRAKTE